MLWLDGKAYSAQLEEEMRQEVIKLKEHGFIPKLVVIMIGSHAASQVYVKNKEKAAERIGIVTETIVFNEEVTESMVISCIQQLNQDEQCHGILVQMPLPKGWDTQKIIMAIDPKKDVDGFHPLNVGLLATEQEGRKPCTPYGIQQLFHHYNIDVTSKNVVMIGRSHIVGRPMVQLLLQENATVTVCHSQTDHIQRYLSEADIVIVAIGQAHWLRKEWLKEGVVVVDVGMNRTEEGLCGDVHPDVAMIASAMTPVPGGVGPMTIAMLMKQTIQSCQEVYDDRING